MNTMVKRVAAVLAVFSVFLLPLPARAGLIDITSLFVFGDSLSDGGNSGLRTQQYTNNLEHRPSAAALLQRAVFERARSRSSTCGTATTRVTLGASRRRSPAAPTTRSVEPPRGRRVSIPVQ